MELVYEVIDEWNGESILDGDLVQCLVVNAHSKFAILLLDKDDWGTIGRMTGFDGSILEEFIQLFLHGVKFQGGHLIDGAPGRSTSWFEFNLVVNVTF